MMISSIRKDLLKVQCMACSQTQNFFKYAKSKVYCKGCTSLLAVPTANKLKVLGRIVKEQKEDV